MKHLLLKTELKTILLFVVISLQSINVSALPEGYSNRFLGTFRYGLFVPPSYDALQKYPLIIMLHGSSDTTSWDLEYYNEPLISSDPCIVITPKCPTTYTDGWGHSWTNEYSYALSKTFEILDSIKKEFSVDTTRLYIFGTSMGGFGVYSALSKNPDMFAAAYVTCGGGNPYYAVTFAKTPLWIFHGSNDPIVSVNYAREMYYAILSVGGTRVRYTEYPGVGHNSWDNVGLETTLPTWLLAQQKGSVHGSPDSVESFQCNLNNNDWPYLEWTPPADESTDDKMIWCYRIYKDYQLFATLNNDRLNIVDSTVVSETQYVYSVTAVNYYFNESSLSPDLAITTPVYPELAIENLLASDGSFSVYPNPVIDFAKFSFNLESNSRVSIQIYNALGQMVEQVTDEVFPQGTQSVEWNPQGISKGLYYGVFESKDKKCTIKILIK
jgi:predicted esterase